MAVKKTSRRRQGQSLTPDERASAQDTFLDMFAKTGIVLRGASAAGIDRQTVYDWKAADPAFAARYELAEADANDHVRAEVYRRGLTGWIETTKVETVGADGETKIETRRVHRFSDAVLMFLAKSRMPEFRDRIDVTSGDEALGVHDRITQIINDPTAADLACELLGRIGRAAAPSGDAGGAGVSGE